MLSKTASLLPSVNFAIETTGLDSCFSGGCFFRRLLLLLAEDRGKEEVYKDLINEILLLYESLTHADVEIVNNLASQLDKTYVDAFIVFACCASDFRSIGRLFLSKIVVLLDLIDDQTEKCLRIENLGAIH